MRAIVRALRYILDIHGVMHEAVCGCPKCVDALRKRVNIHESFRLGIDMASRAEADRVRSERLAPSTRMERQALRAGLSLREAHAMRVRCSAHADRCDDREKEVGS